MKDLLKFLGYSLLLISVVLAAGYGDYLKHKFYYNLNKQMENK